MGGAGPRPGPGGGERAGAGNAGGVNTELPAGWSATRSRPLCPYPQTAQRREGATDLESAASFVCR
ncbi:tannase/feruloyl esterase family alpha/beta hydrolase [Aquabacterium sp. J223]|uniref:tannase/feruloyl esterase family alpha/beta hydrolase n=1 Tax=Aquabacterium sp. J223 TaxID=2898431 RepID=UPI0021ADE6FE|nr:tannase/feruloyl esterase family alpha/beta hydrolase [Aquabacterium sp. J223]UUX94534.1 tannase/feruloyl esterase family alpha/beta hydrolase [Aquabacterium sp. J223]